jgi:hypothetical protein
MSFDINRLRRSDWMIGGGGIALFIFLFFFDWYGASYKGPAVVGSALGVSQGFTGWHTFTNSRWIWLLTIIVAIVAAVLVAGRRKLDLPVQPGTIVAGLGALSTLLILYRVIHHPSGGTSFAGGSFSYGIKIGIWLGLIASAVITYGGYLKIGEEGSSSAPAFTSSSAPASSPVTASTAPSVPAESAAAPLPPPPPSSSGEGG